MRVVLRGSRLAATVFLPVTISTIAFAFDPITLWLLGKFAAILLGGAAVAGVIYLANLSMNTIRSWFSQRTMHVGEVKRVFANSLDTGKYRVVVGFFNTGQNSFRESQAYEADSLDSELSALVAGRKSVTLNLS